MSNRLRSNIKIMAANPSLAADKQAASAAVSAIERLAKARLDSIKQAIEARHIQSRARAC
ncbi:MAG: hypothetical protein JWQ90_3693 [Hydrocarboniphaga sp.]|uniref:hypothetical protein n=1 Tax=Hydrocarboniphaga sp. TaxID=2033016 RepID=UPI00260AFA55|nr:hypothetical protein [Hydrocarboniphaga sp.]MDB5971243.1 hypothetical protein [Hydrocarboniphaga sp.]